LYIYLWYTGIVKQLNKQIISNTVINTNTVSRSGHKISSTCPATKIKKRNNSENSDKFKRLAVHKRRLLSGLLFGTRYIVYFAVTAACNERNTRSYRLYNIHMQ